MVFHIYVGGACHSVNGLKAILYGISHITNGLYLAYKPRIPRVNVYIDVKTHENSWFPVK